MRSESFAYWLQGFFEISRLPAGSGLDGAQVDAIRAHLALVFVHEIDPSAGGPAEQAKLNAIHKPTIGGPDGTVFRC